MVVRSIGVTAAGDVPIETANVEYVEVTLNGKPVALPLQGDDVERLFGENVTITRRASP